MVRRRTLREAEILQGFVALPGIQFIPRPVGCARAPSEGSVGSSILRSV